MTALQTFCAPSTVRWFDVGEHCEDSVAGDVILVDHGTDISWAIRTGQSLAAHLWQRNLDGFTWLDHCAMIRVGGADAIVSEMGPRGHELPNLRRYQFHLYAVVHFDVAVEQRQLVIDADARFDDVHYGFIEYPTLVINGLTNAKFAASYGDSMICSTHVAWCCKNIYFTLDRQDNATMPAHIAKAIGAAHA